MKECPLCGSKDIEVREGAEEHHLIDGTIFRYEQKYLHCNCCTEEFSIPENDINFEKAYKKAQHEFIIKTLKEIKSKGLFFVDIERECQLPFRTLSNWKQGNFSNVSVAFLYLLQRDNFEFIKMRFINEN